VGSEVKGVWLQHIRYPANGVWVEQDATEDSFFGLQVLGWNRIRKGFKRRFLSPTPLVGALVGAAFEGLVLGAGRAHHGLGVVMVIGTTRSILG
jgi:hypothetical protein